MGTMVIAILLGIAWRVVMEIPEAATQGINFAAKNLLKLGATLMGIRLDISQLLVSGSKIILLDTFSHHFYHHLFGVDGAAVTPNQAPGLLIGVGTAVCGASAIDAVAFLVQADDDETTLSVAIIAILGTLETLLLSR